MYPRAIGCAALAIALASIAAITPIAPAHAGELGRWVLTSTSVSEALDPYALESEPGTWRYHAGDDPAWATPSFDDQRWETLDPRLTGGPAVDSWTGVGWFRTRVVVGPELRGRPLAFLLIQSGMTEVYLDGKLIYAIGGARPGVPESVIAAETSIPLPRIIVFDRAEHSLALRLECPWIDKFRWEMGGAGIHFLIADAGELMRFREHHVRQGTVANVICLGASLVLALIHFLLFLVRRRDRQNLYFALGCMTFAGIIIGTNLGRFATTTFNLLLYWTLFKASVVLTALFTLQFAYSAFYEKPPRAFRWVGSGLVALAILAWWLPSAVYHGVTLLALVEEGRVVATGTIRRQRSAWILGVGFLGFVLFTAPQVLAGMHLIPEIPNIFLVGFFSLLVSMSIYLAHGAALLDRDLSKRLIEVERLSQITLEQERRAKDEEIQRKLLEAENERKTLELREAKKLEQALAELQAAHRKLESTQAQLIQAEKMASLGMLVAGIAHEINTPVGAIVSMHDSLARALAKLKAFLTEHAAELLKGHASLRTVLQVFEDSIRVIESGSTRVSTIVKRLRRFARLDEGERKPADLHEGLEDTLLIMSHELKHGTKIIRSFGAIPELVCDPGQLNQVFLNLLINAKQALKPGGGEIEISTRLEGDRVRIAIRDDGVGIPPENLGRIFDPGFTTKGVGVGTGLGLAICYQIVRDHGGELRAESTVGVGTTVTVILPVTTL